MNKSVKWFIFIGIFLILGELVFIFFHSKPTNNNKNTNNNISIEKDTNAGDENIKSICFGSNSISKFTGIPEYSTQYKIDNDLEALDIRGCLVDIVEINQKVVFSIAFFDDRLKEHIYKFEVADDSNFIISTADTFVTTKNNEEIIENIKDKATYIKIFTIIADPQKVYVNADPQIYNTFAEQFVSALNSRNNYPEPLYNLPIVGVGL